MARDKHGNWFGISDGKGKKGQNCNRSSCQEPESAHFYNKLNFAWYCEECAYKIEASARKFGDPSCFDGLDEWKLRQLLFGGQP